MAEDRIDAVLRRLDVRSDPDPAFIDRSLIALAPIAASARHRDGHWLGRFRSTIQVGVADARHALASRPIALVALLLMLLALFMAVASIGNRRPAPIGAEGPLVVSRAGELLSIDVNTRATSRILKTDAAGILTLPADVAGEVLLSTVFLEPPAADGKFHSVFASIVVGR